MSQDKKCPVCGKIVSGKGISLLSLEDRYKTHMKKHKLHIDGKINEGGRE